MKALYILKIKAQPLAGSDINDIKKEAIAYCQTLKCSLEFNHNGQLYLCDNEGNIAKIDKSTF